MTVIDRRRFLGTSLTAGAGLAVTALPSAALATTPSARQFEVVTTVDLSATGSADRLWLPLFKSDRAYQKRLGLSWTSDARVRVVRDRASGTEVLFARWASTDAPRRLTLTERIATWDRTSSASLSTAERNHWLASSPGLPTDGIVRDTAQRIVGALTDPRAKTRAIYDWVIANTWRDPATAGCGNGDIAGMLANGRMGGKCADINSLMVGLCRAAGVPARDIYGVRLAPSHRFKSLGRGGGDVTTAQHCRAEVWLDGTGWFAVDPADVRKTVLEEKLPVDSTAIRDLAETLFGGWESNWGGYNSASDMVLADAPLAPQFHFLMYPCAMSDSERPNCLDASNFAYRITSREIMA